MLLRQQQLKLLTRKYAADIDGVLAWRDKAEAKLSSIDVSSEAVEKLKKDTAAAEKKMLAAAKKTDQKLALLPLKTRCASNGGTSGVGHGEVTV